MPVTPDPRPDVIRSEVDPDFDCVRLGSTAPGGRVATPPGPDEAHATGAPRLCPEGYVPKRRREPYESEGKRVISEKPPRRNPNARQ